ncbi:MAG: KH domain-containing protein [Candidatus Izemoplasmatales bacterium]|nr:KH domain-containing protein [Candidatus Izemoplasmatales bacterium]
MAVNFEKLVLDLVTPLVINVDDLIVKKFSEDESSITIQVLVNKDDLGRVIGKGGKIANAIRTIAYAAASKIGKRINIDIDAFE